MSKFVIKKKQGIFSLPTDDIVYMEKNLRKICLHVRKPEYKGGYEIEFYGRFADVMPQLDDRFMHCHRSYVINMDEIVWMSGNEIFILPDITIPMGRDTYGKARKTYLNYLGRKYPEKRLENTKIFL